MFLGGIERDQWYKIGKCSKSQRVQFEYEEHVFLLNYPFLHSDLKNPL